MTKVKGNEIDQEKVEKIFQNVAKKESTKLIQMLNEIPIAYFNCTEEILRQNQGFFENKTTNSTILSLTDHIYDIEPKYQLSYINFFKTSPSLAKSIPQ